MRVPTGLPALRSGPYYLQEMLAEWGGSGIQALSDKSAVRDEAEKCRQELGACSRSRIPVSQPHVLFKELGAVEPASEVFWAIGGEFSLRTTVAWEPQPSVFTDSWGAVLPFEFGKEKGCC